MSRPDWSRPLPQPLNIPTVMKLLADVRDLVEKHLPEQYRRKPTWQHVSNEIAKAAEGREGSAGNLCGAPPGASARGRQMPHELMACRVGDIRQPEASDFEVKVLPGGVQVNFKPTFSYYWFDQLIRPHNMIQKLGSISSSATVRHMGWTGGTEDYSADEVATVAHRLASEAAAEAYTLKPAISLELRAAT